MNDIQSNLNCPFGRSSRRSQRQPNGRLGFTLIELLLVIAIMAVLATMGLAVMRSSVEDAKAAATQTTITKIESMLQLQLEQYEVRRLPVSRQILESLVSEPDRLLKIRNLKHRLIANMLCAEMPRPFPTGIDAQTGEPLYTPNSNCNGLDQIQLGDFPVDKTLAPMFPAAFWKQIKPAAVNRWGEIAKNKEFKIPAEYLYEILKGIDFDGINGLEGVGANAIGDSNDNKVFEIVDAWGDPLKYKIEQVRAKKVFKKELYVDEDVFDDLNTQIPRSLEKIRITVTSPNLPQ